jgi:hypothetical protein
MAVTRADNSLLNFGWDQGRVSSRNSLTILD